MSPEPVADEIIPFDLAGIRAGDLDVPLRRAAEMRSTLPRFDGVALARAARADLEARGVDRRR